MKTVDERTKTNLEIILTFPSQESLIIIPRLVISGLLSNYKITLEEIENTKLLISEAINLLIDKTNYNNITLKISLEDKQNTILLRTIITSKTSKYILQNLSKSGLTIHILSYLCSKFSAKELGEYIEILLEKEINRVE